MTFMYHQTEAPQGRRFTADELAALSAEWVDTPAKFAPNEAEKTGDEAEKPRRGRPKKTETVQ